MYFDIFKKPHNEYDVVCTKEADTAEDALADVKITNLHHELDWLPLKSVPSELISVRVFESKFSAREYRKQHGFKSREYLVRRFKYPEHKYATNNRVWVLKRKSDGAILFDNGEWLYKKYHKTPLRWR